MLVRRIHVVLILSIVLLVSGAPHAGAQQSSSQATVDLIEVRGLIDPPMSDFLLERLQGADEDGVQAAILQIDSPGALDAEIEQIVSLIDGSDVPVVAWIAPRGAEAENGAAHVALAADLLFVGPEADVRTSAEANLVGPAADTTSGSPAETSVDVADAAPDGEAASLGELLNALDGRRAGETTIETWDGESGAPSVRVRFQGMTLTQRVLHGVISPEVALALFLIGIFGLIFEVYNPGIGLAAIVGIACLVLALYALTVLPTNWLGVLVLVAASAALLLDVHTGNLGLASGLGVAGTVGGSVWMFSGAPEPLRLDWWFVLLVLFGTVLFFISVMTAALRVRLRRPVTDDDGLVGTVAEARTDIAPEGTVFTKGSLWRARTMETGIAAGEKVEVKAIEGLVLLVEPLHDPEHSTGH